MGALKKHPLHSLIQENTCSYLSIKVVNSKVGKMQYIL